MKNARILSAALAGVLFGGLLAGSAGADWNDTNATTRNYTDPQYWDNGVINDIISVTFTDGARFAPRFIESDGGAYSTTANGMQFTYDGAYNTRMTATVATTVTMNGDFLYDPVINRTGEFGYSGNLTFDMNGYSVNIGGPGKEEYRHYEGTPVSFQTDLINGAGDGGIHKIGDGRLRIDCAASYSGPTIVENGQFQLTDSGSIANTTALKLMGPTSALWFGEVFSAGPGAGSDAIADDLAIDIYGGEIFLHTDNGDGATTAEDVGTLNFLEGCGSIQMRLDNRYNNVRNELSADGLARSNRATANLVATNWGGSTGTVYVGEADGSGNMNAVLLDTAPTQVGGGGGAGTTNISILPWMAGAIGLKAGNTLVTYDAGADGTAGTADDVGLRLLDNRTTAEDGDAIEYKYDWLETEHGTINADDNFFVQAGYKAGEQRLYGREEVTVNALVVGDDAAFQLKNAGETDPHVRLHIASGALFANADVGEAGTSQWGRGIVDFDTAEGIVLNTAQARIDINVPLDGENGVTFGAASTHSGSTNVDDTAGVITALEDPATYTGQTTINSGILATLNPTGNIPDGSNVVVQQAGTLHVGDTSTTAVTETIGGLGGNGQVVLNVAGSSLLVGSGLAGAGEVAIEAGGTLAPGMSIGELTIGQTSQDATDINLALNTGADLQWEVASDTEADRVVVAGDALVFGGDLTVTELDSYSPTLDEETRWTILTAATVTDPNGGSVFDSVSGRYYVEIADTSDALELVAARGGDVNKDGVVDGLDLTALASNWDATGAGWSDGDINGDGTVDGLDLTALAGNWNEGNGIGTIPEPATLGLLSLGGLGVLLRRRRR